MDRWFIHIYPILYRVSTRFNHPQVISGVSSTPPGGLGEARWRPAASGALHAAKRLGSTAAAAAGADPAGPGHDAPGTGDQHALVDP